VQSQTEVAGATPARACDRPARVTKTLLAYGVIAGPFYVVVSLAQAFTREGFDPTRHAWSQLAGGDLGWIHSANLIVSGLMAVAGAVGLRRALPPGRGGAWAAGLLSVYGLGMVGGGVFAADPGRGFPPGTPETVATSGYGSLHLTLSGIGFLCLVAACFVLASRFSAERLRIQAAFSRVTGALYLATFVGLAASGGGSAGIVGFTVAVLLAAAWLSMVSLHHYRRVAQP
jgi:hypothetical membrane protein